jgi:uncharacterized protein (DUF4415 family)
LENDRADQQPGRNSDLDPKGGPHKDHLGQESAAWRRKGVIVRYTPEEIEEMRRRGEDRTDWAKVDAMTEADIERLTEDDTEENIEWGEWQVGIPLPKRHVSLRIDVDVLDWFKRQGRGYQARINAVLRAYVTAQREKSVARKG